MDEIRIVVLGVQLMGTEINHLLPLRAQLQSHLLFEFEPSMISSNTHQHYGSSPSEVVPNQGLISPKHRRRPKGRAGHLQKERFRKPYGRNQINSRTFLQMDAWEISS